MKKLNKYTMLWNIISQVNIKKLKENELYSILLQNLNKKQAKKLLKEYEDVYDLIEEPLLNTKNGEKYLFNKDYEIKNELISKIIINGLDCVLKSLEDEDKYWEIAKNTKIYLCYEIPYESDYEEDIEDNDKLVLKEIEKSENKIKFIKENGKHLSEDFLKSLENDYKYFKETLLSALNGNLKDYNREDYYKKLKEYQEKYIWASYVYANLNKIDMCNTKKNIVGYSYPNIIEELINNRNTKGIKLKL